tara:strand:+ start:244 stop:429 length:186 start_codon:yes stop_codon:yes gene_type:complete
MEVKQRVVTILAAAETAATAHQKAELHKQRDELWAEVLQDLVRGNWIADHLAIEALKLLEV